MDPLPWAKRLQDDPPKRPGEALARTLSALVTFCNEATPIAPKNITPAFFDALRDDPEFDDIAAEVLSVVSSYYADEAASQNPPGLARSSSTPRVEEVIGAAFEHAAEATGAWGAVLLSTWEDASKYWEYAKKGMGTVDAISKLLDGPAAYVLFLTCGTGLLIQAGNTLMENQGNPGEAPRAWAKKLSVRSMLVGLLWFSGNHWTRINTAFDTPSDPATVWTPYRTDRDLYWRKNATTRLLYADRREFKEVIENYEANTTLTQRDLRGPMNNYYMLEKLYERHGNTPEALFKYPSRKVRRAAQQAVVEYSSREDALLNVLPALETMGNWGVLDTELGYDAGEQQSDRLLEMLSIVLEDYQNGNEHYHYYNYWKGFFFFGFLAGEGGLLLLTIKQKMEREAAEKAAKEAREAAARLRDVYGGVQPMEGNELHEKLVKMNARLMDASMRPYWGNAGPGPVNWQDDINEAARIILELARRRAFDVLDAVELEDRMRVLVDIRRDADRFRGKGNDPIRGALNADQQNQVWAIRNDTNGARNNWDQNNPGDRINASCADGSSSVVDALFARVGL